VKVAGHILLEFCIFIGLFAYARCIGVLAAVRQYPYKSHTHKCRNVKYREISTLVTLNTSMNAISVHLYSAEHSNPHEP